MGTLKRKTINFDHADSAQVGPFLDEGSPEHAALEQLVGERLASDSAELRALVLLGVGRVWSFRYLDEDRPEPVVIVSNDGRNRSRFEWVHVVRITTRPKRPLPTIVELSDRDDPLTGRAMTDELELVHKADLEELRGMLSPPTMAAIDDALRDVLALH